MIKPFKFLEVKSKPVRHYAIELTQELRQNLGLAPDWLQKYLSKPLGWTESICPRTGVFSNGFDELVLIRKGSSVNINYGDYIVYCPSLDEIYVMDKQKFNELYG